MTATTTSAAHLIEKVKSLGLELVVDGQELRLRGPSHLMDADLVTMLKASKAELLEMLSTPEPAASFCIPDDCCPGCSTIWRTSKGRWLFTGRDDDVRKNDPGAVLIVRADGGCGHGR